MVYNSLSEDVSHHYQKTYKIVFCIITMTIKLISPPSSKTIVKSETECSFTGEKIQLNEPAIKLSKYRMNKNLYMSLKKVPYILEKISKGDTEGLKGVKMIGPSEIDCDVCDERGPGRLEFSLINFKVCDDCVSSVLSFIHKQHEEISEGLEYFHPSGFRVEKVKESYSVQGAKIEDEYALHVGASRSAIGIKNCYVKLNNLDIFLEKIQEKQNRDSRNDEVDQCSICEKETEGIVVENYNHYRPFVCKECIPRLVEGIEEFMKERSELIVSSKI